MPWPRSFVASIVLATTSGCSPGQSAAVVVPIEAAATAAPTVATAVRPPSLQVLAECPGNLELFPMRGALLGYCTHDNVIAQSFLVRNGRVLVEGGGWSAELCERLLPLTHSFESFYGWRFGDGNRPPYLVARRDGDRWHTFTLPNDQPLPIGMPYGRGYAYLATIGNARTFRSVDEREIGLAALPRRPQWTSEVDDFWADARAKVLVVLTRNPHPVLERWRPDGVRSFDVPVPQGRGDIHSLDVVGGAADDLYVLVETYQRAALVAHFDGTSFRTLSGPWEQNGGLAHVRRDVPVVTFPVEEVGRRIRAGVAWFDRGRMVKRGLFEGDVALLGDADASRAAVAVRSREIEYAAPDGSRVTLALPCSRCEAVDAVLSEESSPYVLTHVGDEPDRLLGTQSPATVVRLSPPHRCRSIFGGVLESRHADR